MAHGDEMAHDGRPLSEVIAALGAIAPLPLAESWDKVGLLVAGDGRAVSKALLAIDVTSDVLDEAKALGAQLIVGYHPLLFKPLERLDGGSWQCRVAIDAVRAGIAIYSPHTALDAVDGGVNDWLLESVAAAAGGSAHGVAALVAAAAQGATHKIVVFVPEDSADRVREALSAAGAGVIGAYSHCSFTLVGEGTFLGGEGSAPAVGARGRLERVREVRLEMPLPRRALSAAIAALHAAHPYEEPAFDVVPLEPVPTRTGPRTGAGRVGTLSRLSTARALAPRLAEILGCGPLSASREVARGGVAATHGRVAVCAGSGASLLDAAARAGATLFVTGELSHHDVLRAHALGLEVLLAGHTNTERGYLPRLAAALAERAPGLECVVSVADCDPLG
ncbi:MAG: Nif3-like dinuclear metal center hexameric protein [Phycisphaera sp.]|nr:Nif3-like dinuclear metal center hexameric protein [Phycisphaera sp.]